jgi:hypothetical protein
MKYLKYFEAVTDRFLYHFTSSIKKILESNRINLSSHLGTRADKSDKFFFLSLSRASDPFAGYGRLGGDTGSSRIVFDKDKLKQNFKVIPFDYWQERNVEKLPAFKDVKSGKGTTKELNYQINMRNEFEERIVSDKSYIDNISKYIERIDLIGAPSSNAENPLHNNNLYEEIQLAKKLGIKCFVYKNKKDMMYAKNNIIDEIKYQKTDEEPYVDYYTRQGKDRFDHYEDLVALFMYDKKYFDDFDLFKEDLEKYLEKYKLDLALDPNKVLSKLRELSYRSRDFLPSIEADIHNYFKGGHSGKLREIVGVFIKQMKLLGVKSILELMDLKIEGLRPKSQPKKDWSKIYALSKYEWDYEDEKWYYKEISNSELFKDYHIHFSTWKYGGYIPEEDWYKMHTIEQNNGTIGDILNFIFNKYIDKIAIKIIEESSTNYRNEKEYKVVLK